MLRPGLYECLTLIAGRADPAPIILRWRCRALLSVQNAVGENGACRLCRHHLSLRLQVAIRCTNERKPPPPWRERAFFLTRTVSEADANREIAPVAIDIFALPESSADVANLALQVRDRR